MSLPEFVFQEIRSLDHGGKSLFILVPFSFSPKREPWVAHMLMTYFPLAKVSSASLESSFSLSRPSGRPG